MALIFDHRGVHTAGCCVLLVLQLRTGRGLGPRKLDGIDIRSSRGAYGRVLRAARSATPNWTRIEGELNALHQQGDLRATYALASWYLHGEHLAKDWKKAVQLLQMASLGQVPEALFDLAICYEKGAGVRRNHKKAFRLFLEAAFLGHADAIYEVGRCYFYGMGVAPDRSIAAVCLTVARQRGAPSDS